MKCHDVLGIAENAAAGDIDRAYGEKLAVLDKCKDVLSQQQYRQKSGELLEAREQCFAWQKKAFAEKTVEKVRGYSDNLFSGRRLHSVCIGPCTCADSVGGICTCDSTRADLGFLVGCCGCEDAGLAIFCDIIIYAALGISAYVSHNKKQCEIEEQQAREYHARMRQETEADLSRKQQELAAISGRIEELGRQRKQAMEDLRLFNCFAAFIYSIGSACDFDEMRKVLRNNSDKLDKDYAAALSKQKKIQQAIESLNRRLSQ